MRDIKNLKVAMVQMNTVSGDIANNYKFVEEQITKLSNYDVDIIVFPETAISGYFCGSNLDNVDFIKEQEDLIKNLINIVPFNICVVIGYISLHGIKKNGLPRLKNSVAVINNGNFYSYDKQLLAGTDHHEDKKYFEPGKETKIFEIKLKDIILKIGTPICEDIWFEDHIRNIPKEMKEMGAEILISVNQSYFYYGKSKIREKLLNKISKSLEIPIFYVNSCCVGDIVKNILIIDGNSMISYNGKIIKKLPSFKYNNTLVSEDLEIEEEIYKPYDKYDEIIDALIFEQREFFDLIGIKNAQVHLSGGLDSSIVAALVVAAMGKENVIFITNPSNLNSDSIKYAKHTANMLGVELYINPIQTIYDEILKIDSESFDSELSAVGKSTIQATLRSCLGLYSTHRFKSGIVPTFNFVELSLGWSNFHDIGSIGVHGLIGDLTKIELYELADKLNKRYAKEIIPEGLYNGKIKPAAELPDVGNNEDPIDYYIQSCLCVDVIRNNKSKKQLINDYVNKNLDVKTYPYFNNKCIYELYTLEKFIDEIDFTIKKTKFSVYKAAQGAPIVNISPRSRGFSSRETLINKYKQ
jgi:NAD+ synthase (glutamine-hydrolysing)